MEILTKFLFGSVVGSRRFEGGLLRGEVWSVFRRIDCGVGGEWAFVTTVGACLIGFESFAGGVCSSGLVGLVFELAENSISSSESSRSHLPPNQVSNVLASIMSWSMRSDILGCGAEGSCGCFVGDMRGPEAVRFHCIWRRLGFLQVFVMLGDVGQSVIVGILWKCSH